MSPRTNGRSGGPRRSPSRGRGGVPRSGRVGAPRGRLSRQNRVIAMALAGVVLLVVLAIRWATGDLDLSGGQAAPEPTSLSAQEALRELDGLQVAAEVREGYQRERFGGGWGDLDGDSCDTRQEILQRDLDDVVASDGCRVDAGVLKDPYTGEDIRFTRGAQTSSEVQIDHVVAAAQAWYSGAYAWDEAERVEFFNDPDNLLAVDGPTNNSKGAKSAAEWLPGNAAYRCEYVGRQIHVKAKYHLTVDSDESAAMRRVLAAC